MTSPKLKLVLEKDDELRNLGSWSNTLKSDDRLKFRDSARKSLDDYVLKIARENGVEGLNSPEDLTKPGNEKIYKGALELGSQIARRASAQTLYDNREQIINKELPNSSLDKILGGVNGKVFLERVSVEDGEALRAFLSYKGIEALAESYERGEELPDDKKIKELVSDAMARGAVKEKEKIFKEYDAETRELAKALVYTASIQGLVDKDNERKYVIDGMKEVLNKSKERAKEAGDGYKIARKILLKMVESDNPKEFEMAGNLLAQYVSQEDVEKHYKAAA